MKGSAGGGFKITPGLIVFAVVVLYFAMLLRSDWVMLNRLLTEKARLQQDMAGATAKKERLRREIAELNDPQHIELVARQKLGLIRPGETAYKVVR